MKSTIILIFIFLFLIFVIAGFLFYRYSLSNLSLAADAPLEAEVVTPASLIYFSQGTNLYRFKTANENQTEAKEELFSQEGEIGELAIDAANETVAFEIKNPEAGWEIWLADTHQFQKRRFAYREKEGLENLTDFLKPKFNGEGKIAFIGRGTSSDALIIADTATETLTKIGEDLGLKITDFSWNPSGDKLIFCSENLSKNACWQSLIGGEPSRLFENEIKKIIWPKDSEILYLSREETPHLYLFQLTDQSSLPLDDVLSPKQILSFRIDPSAEKIVYEVRDGEKSAIYLSSLYGSNRLELIEDSGRQPIFSPDGQEIAFFEQRDGIFKININQTNQSKILNFDDSINSLLIWR